MPAYAIGRITVTDPDAWAQYRAGVGPTLAPYGGEVVMRGTQAQSCAGEEQHHDVVVLRFPDLDTARHWHASPAYQALVPLRLRAADVVLTLYTA